jgi:hypothetical protein
MDELRYCVYLLRCPDTGEVRYVGYTYSEGNRRDSHSRHSERVSCPVSVWKRRLAAKGKSAAMEIVCRVHTPKLAHQLERELIEHFVAINGPRMLNRVGNPLWFGWRKQKVFAGVLRKTSRFYPARWVRSEERILNLRTRTPASQPGGDLAAKQLASTLSQ